MLYLTGIVIAVLVLNRFVIINSVVPSASMVPTIFPKSRVIGLRTTVLSNQFDRGDILVFYAPDEPGTLYIKRVIGTPGDTVEIKKGITYINGDKLSEYAYVDPDYWYNVEEENYGPFEVPEGHYFMMGDNRGNSHDSRKWTQPYVSEDAIIGRAFFTYWPFQHLGILK